jgi:hypothetical protein
LTSAGATAHKFDIGTKERQNSRRGAKSPEIIPKHVRAPFALR